MCPSLLAPQQAWRACVRKPSLSWKDLLGNRRMINRQSEGFGEYLERSRQIFLGYMAISPNYAVVQFVRTSLLDPVVGPVPDSDPGSQGDQHTNAL
jgi:hypothetical protein